MLRPNPIKPINVPALLAGKFHNEAQWVVDPPNASMHEARNWDTRAEEARLQLENDRRTGEKNPEGKYLSTLIEQIYTVLSSKTIFMHKADVEDMLECLEDLIETDGGVLTARQKVVVGLMTPALLSFLGDMSGDAQNNVIAAAHRCLEMMASASEE